MIVQGVDITLDMNIHAYNHLFKKVLSILSYCIRIHEDRKRWLLLCIFVYNWINVCDNMFFLYNFVQYVNFSKLM